MGQKKGEKKEKKLPELAFEVVKICDAFTFAEASGACSEAFPFNVKELIAQLFISFFQF